MRALVYRKIKRNVRNVLGNKLFSVIFTSFSIVALSLFLIFSSVTFNVYLHEFAHYKVADYYGLDPSIDIQNIIELGESRNIVFNANPKAFTTFTNPENSKVNFEVTIAGPLMNLLITLVFSAIYVVLRYSLFLKSRHLKHHGNHHALWNHLKFSFMIDVIFVSIIIPSLVSVFVNFSNIPGSDGSILRSLM